MRSVTGQDLSTNHHYCTPEEAAKYLGKTPQEFAALVKQFGIGRYHLPRLTDQIVYSMDELGNARHSLDHMAEVA